MTTFDPLILQATQSSTRAQSDLKARECSLYWRQHQLLVLHAPAQRVRENLHRGPRVPILPPLQHPAWLSECLKRSTIQLVRVDLQLGEAALAAWAAACAPAGKALYLRLPSAAKLPQNRIGRLWQCKRFLDGGVAALSLIVLSPVWLGISVAIALTSPGPILLRQWRVGARGKLFQAFKFRTVSLAATSQPGIAEPPANGLPCEDKRGTTPIGKWLRQRGLDQLPQLINVLRGEISLVGPRPWGLDEAVWIRPERQACLNALPGLLGIGQLEARSRSLDVEQLSGQYLNYLETWSFSGDLKILGQSLLKLLSGRGDC